MIFMRNCSQNKCACMGNGKSYCASDLKKSGNSDTTLK